MEPSRYRKDARSLTYFAPDTFTLTVSHPRDMSPEQVVDQLAETRVGRENNVLNESLRRLSEVVRRKERLPLRYEPSSRFWEEERAELPPLRGHDKVPSAISLVFADIPFKRRRSDKELIALVDDVNRQLENLDDAREVVLQAIVPSWFCNATPKVIGTGGPGARPVAAPPLDEQ